MAGSDVIGCLKGGATAIVKFIFISNSCRANNLAKTKMSDVAGPIP